MHNSDSVNAFKQQLGIHHTEESAFGWIAEVGLQSPLPPRWTSHTDTGSGYVYYVDHDHQASSWENPLVPHLRRIVEIGRAYLENPTESFFEDQKGNLWHQHKHALDCWHGPFSDHQGRQYFVNSSEGVSSWQDPRVDAQYLFELESGLLTSLEEVLPPPPQNVPQFGLEGEEAAGWVAASQMGWTTCDEQWRTAEGADVLTIGSQRPRSHRRPVEARTNQAQQEAKEEHKTTLERMCATADRVRRLHQDEEEAQRINIKRKVEARRREIASAAGAVAAAASNGSQGRPAPPAVADAGAAAALGAQAAAPRAPPRTPQQLAAAPTSRPPAQFAAAAGGAPQAGAFAPPATLPPEPGLLPPPTVVDSPLGQSITSVRGGLLVGKRPSENKQWEPLDSIKLNKGPDGGDNATDSGASAQSVS